MHFRVFMFWQMSHIPYSLSGLTWLPFNYNISLQWISYQAVRTVFLGVFKYLFCNPFSKRGSFFRIYIWSIIYYFSYFSFSYDFDRTIPIYYFFSSIYSPYRLSNIRNVINMIKGFLRSLKLRCL